MATLNPTARRRWYDQKPELSRCVSLLAAFPAEVQAIVGDGLVYLAEKEFKAHSLLSSLKSLGPEKVLGIYKAQNRRRSIDAEPGMFQTLNYFYMLSPENQLLMAQMTIELVGYIARYFEACKLYRKDSRREHLIELTDRYVRTGGKEAQLFLERITRLFRQGIDQGTHIHIQPVLQDQQRGMGLKKGPND